MKNRLNTPFVLLLLFLAAWAPRVFALDAFVTPDEPTWLYRSANFYRAISHGDFAGTFQREHPGVTVTWAGALAFLQRLPDYAQEGPGQLSEGQLEPWLAEHSPVEPLQLLAAARWWIVLWIALITTAAYFPLRKLLGAQAAALAVLLMAWDPFFIALSRQLHLDGLLASLTVLALLNFLAWLHGERQLRYLVVSGVVTGLALLTKTPAVVLLPTAGLLVLVEWLRRIRTGKNKSPALLLAFVAWLALVVVTVVGLWPAMWVAPLDVLGSMIAGLRVHAEGHDSLNFFFGRTTDDPGLFFYPVAYLFRSTPAALIGLVAAFVLGWRRRWPFDGSRVRRSALGLVVFALLFAAVMTLGAKKFDRYLSPIFPAVDIVAALGWLGLAQAVLAWWNRRSRPVPAETGLIRSNLVSYRLSPGTRSKNISRKAAKSQSCFLASWRLCVSCLSGSSGLGSVKVLLPALAGLRPSQRRNLFFYESLVSLCGLAVLCVAFLLHGLFAFVHYPYYFTYYNPLAGGSRTAPEVLLVGWGEGLDAAAGWLGQQPDSENMRVISWYSDGPLSYFLRPGQKPLSFYFTSYLFDADYAVLYVNQWQRGLPSPELVNYFLAQKPARIVRSGGLELARIYDVRNQPPPEFVHIITATATNFGDRMRLAAYRLDKQSALPGDQAAITLYLKKLAEVDAAYNVLLRLIGPDGVEVWREEGWPAGESTTSWPIGEVRYDDHQIVIPADAPPGRYRLMLSFYDPKTAELLSPAGDGVSHEVASIAISAPGTGGQTSSSPAAGSGGQAGETDVSPGARSVEISARWADLQLTTLQHAQRMTPGDTLLVELSARGRVDGSFKLSARLVDSSGAVKAQNDVKLGPYTRIGLDLPEDAEPGIYTLAVVLYDPETLAPFQDSAGKFLTALSQVEVLGVAAQ